MTWEESALRLAREATNGWACYAKRQIEHDEIARLHVEIERLRAENCSPSRRERPQNYRIDRDSDGELRLLAEVSSPATPQLRSVSELAEVLKRFWNTLPEQHRHLSLLSVIDELAQAVAASPATPVLDVFQRIFHVANLALGEPPATRMADTGALVEIAMLAEQALKAQR